MNNFTPGKIYLSVKIIPANLKLALIPFQACKLHNICQGYTLEIPTKDISRRIGHVTNRIVYFLRYVTNIFNKKKVNCIKIYANHFDTL